MILEATQHRGPNWFGERLREQRETADVSLDVICAETKISRRVLQALEAGEFKHLPERVFSRAFVTQYAAVIGCDPAPLLADFDTAWEHYEVDSGGYAAAQLFEPPPKPPIRWGFWFPMAVGVGILTSAAVVILSGSEPSQAALVQTARRPGATSPPTVTPAGLAILPSTAVGQNEQNEGTENDDVVALAIRVAGEKECWIHYRDREGRTDQRLIAGGSTLRLELDGPVKLTIGNAGAATLIVGGVEYTGLGIPGQVVHTEVSREGVRTLGAGDAHG